MSYLLSEINEAVRQDPQQFAVACDEDYAKKIVSAARAISTRRDRSRVILLSGPSGSGKTTTALRIEDVLDHSGVETHTISMDDYFRTVDPDTSPRALNGDYDFESPFCLDVELLNKHFSMLDRNEAIDIPKYDFTLHARLDNVISQTLKLGPDEMAIFEGIHALNDVIVGKNPKAFKLYIAARSNIVDDDGAVVFRHGWMRLCRRVIRDFKFRGNPAARTLQLYANVSRGERLYITPYKENADLLFDSSLACECSVLKPFVVPLLKEVDLEEFPIVADILAGYEQIEAMSDEYLADNSLIREFIGGSALEYD